jgi:hypothetical protein
MIFPLLQMGDNPWPPSFDNPGSPYEYIACLGLIFWTVVAGWSVLVSLVRRFGG